MATKAEIVAQNAFGCGPFLPGPAGPANENVCVRAGRSIMMLPFVVDASRRTGKIA